MGGTSDNNRIILVLICSKKQATFSFFRIYEMHHNDILKTGKLLIKLLFIRPVALSSLHIKNTKHKTMKRIYNKN